MPRSLLAPLIVLLAVVTFAVGLAMLAPHGEIGIESTEIRPDTGRAFLFEIRAGIHYPFVLSSDIGTGDGSTLRLLENGVELPFPHAIHESIRQLGDGRYSHWGNFVIFAAPGNTDPRTNGRHYSVRYHATTSPVVVWVIALLVAGGLAWLTSCVASRALVVRVSALMHRSLLAPLMAMLTVGALAVGLAILAPHGEIGIDSTEIRPDTGRAFAIEIRTRIGFPFVLLSSIDTGEESKLRVLENGVELRFPHSDHESIRQLGDGRYAHWGNVVMFAASDNTDPRTNGRHYSLRYYASTSPVAIWIIALFGTGALAWLASSVVRTAGLDKVAPGVRGRQRIAPLLAVVLIAATPSVVLLMNVPPIYTDLTMFHGALAPTYFMPHYPPLYAYFVWATHRIGGLLSGKVGQLTDRGLYTMVLLQHLLFAGSLVYVAIGCAKTLVGRSLVILPFVLAPAALLINNGLQTEAIWLSCLIFMFGATYRIVAWRPPGVAPFVVYLLSIIAALLIRPTALFLLTFPILSIVFVSLAQNSLRRRCAALMLGATVAAIFWSSAINWAVMTANGIAYRSVWGRGTIEVIQRIVWRLEAEGAAGERIDRAELVPALESSTEDAELRQAIPIIIEYLDADYKGTGKATVWGGAERALMRTGTMTDGGYTRIVDLAAADILINRFCVQFFRTFPALILESSTRSTMRYLDLALGIEPDDGLRSTLAFKLWAIDYIIKEPSYAAAPGARSISMTTHNVEVLRAHEQLAASNYIRYVDRLRDVHVVVIIIILVIFGTYSKATGSDEICLALAGFGSIIGYVIAVSTLLAVITRYQIPYQLLLIFLLAALLGRIADWAMERKSRTQNNKEVGISPHADR